MTERDALIRVAACCHAAVLAWRHLRDEPRALNGAMRDCADALAVLDGIRRTANQETK